VMVGLCIVVSSSISSSLPRIPSLVSRFRSSHH
jgi:hypothetical protein